MELVSRVKNILIDPQNEWRVIDGEPDTPANILKNYVAIVAAIPVVCSFIGASIIGVGPYRTGHLARTDRRDHPLRADLGRRLCDRLRDRSAGAELRRPQGFHQGLQGRRYAPTAVWVAGVFSLLPVLSALTILGSTASICSISAAGPDAHAARDGDRLCARRDRLRDHRVDPDLLAAARAARHAAVDVTVCCSPG
jgi:hypothetical protein